MAQPIIDHQGWPVVFITFAAMADESEVEIYLQTLKPLYERGQKTPFVSLADLSHIAPTSISGELRSRLAAGLADLEGRYPGSKLGEGAIVQSGLTRAVYQALNLMRPRAPYERRVFATKAEAQTWARALCHKKAI